MTKEYNCRTLTGPHKKPFVSEIKVLSEVDHDDTYAADQGLDATPYYVYAKTVIFYPINKTDVQMITIKSRGCSGVYSDFEIIAEEEIENLKEILTSFNVNMDKLTIKKYLPDEGPQE